MPEGDVRRVEIVDVEISGRRRVAVDTILDALARAQLHPGSVIVWPEDPRVRQARDQLVATGNFRRVTLRLVPVSDRRDQGALFIEVEERASLELTDLDLATSKLTPIWGGLGLLERNLFGRNLHLGGGFVLGSRPTDDWMRGGRRQQAYEVGMSAPGLVLESVGVSVRGSWHSASEPSQAVLAGLREPNAGEPPAAINYRRAGGRVGTSIPFTASASFGVGFRFESVRVELPRELRGREPASMARFGLHPGRQSVNALEFSFAWDGRVRRDSLGVGGRIRMDLHLSSPAIGSDYEYMMVVLGAAHTWRLPWGHLLTPRIVAGQIAGDAPRYERFHPGDLAAWAPGRSRALSFADRRPFDILGSGIDRVELASLMGRFELAYTIPLFTRIATAFVMEGRLFVTAGVYAVGGNADERARARALGLWPVPMGIDANLGVEFDTALGHLRLSVGNIMQRLAL